MSEMNMQAARALVTKAELESLLAAPDSAVRAEPEFAEAGPPDADADRRMFEQSNIGSGPSAICEAK